MDCVQTAFCFMEDLALPLEVAHEHPVVWGFLLGDAPFVRSMAVWNGTSWTASDNPQDCEGAGAVVVEHSGEMAEMTTAAAQHRDGRFTLFVLRDIDVRVNGRRIACNAHALLQNNDQIDMPTSSCAFRARFLPVRATTEQQTTV